jgi:hypothetical protein
MNWRQALEAAQNVLLRQVQGRARIWRLALYLTLTLLLFRLQGDAHTCELKFHPLELAKDYAVFGACVFLLAGLTNRGKLLFGIVILIALIASVDLVNLRIPRNERSTVHHLQEIYSDVASAKLRASEIPKALKTYPFDHLRRSGYCFEYSLDFSPSGSVIRYSVGARPCYYCGTGQRSYVMEENGRIHYTFEDRSATTADPVIE